MCFWFWVLTVHTKLWMHAKEYYWMGIGLNGLFVFWGCLLEVVTFSTVLSPDCCLFSPCCWNGDEKPRFPSCKIGLSYLYYIFIIIYFLYIHICNYTSILKPPLTFLDTIRYTVPFISTCFPSFQTAEILGDSKFRSNKQSSRQRMAPKEGLWLPIFTMVYSPTATYCWDSRWGITWGLCLLVDSDHDLKVPVYI